VERFVLVCCSNIFTESLIETQTIFGGKVAYVPQVPWIRNETVKNNILFGEAHDENRSVLISLLRRLLWILVSDRLQEVVDTCSLRYDMDVLPHGLETEIGEKGINLSGVIVFFL
jgi:ABC-type multidrug transport system fused ATPase/permease subunit